MLGIRCAQERSANIPMRALMRAADSTESSLEARRELLGPFELATTFRFGGLPFEHAESSLRLFAKEVLPVIKTWN